MFFVRENSIQAIKKESYNYFRKKKIFPLSGWYKNKDKWDRFLFIDSDVIKETRAGKVVFCVQPQQNSGEDHLIFRM